MIYYWLFGFFYYRLHELVRHFFKALRQVIIIKRYVGTEPVFFTCIIFILRYRQIFENVTLIRYSSNRIHTTIVIHNIITYLFMWRFNQQLFWLCPIL